MIGTRAADLAGELRETGVVVLPDPLPSDFVETLREAFEPVLEAYVAASDPNRGTRRHQMYLPFEGPFGDARLWANPTVLDVVEQVLGPDFECTYYGSDTPFPGSGYQPVHQDGGPLFPEWASRPPPYCIAMRTWSGSTARRSPARRPNRIVSRARPDRSCCATPGCGIAALPIGELRHALCSPSSTHGTGFGSPCSGRPSIVVTTTGCPTQGGGCSVARTSLPSIARREIGRDSVPTPSETQLPDGSISPANSSIERRRSSIVRDGCTVISSSTPASRAKLRR